jgi:hypothetical protein
MHQTSVLGGQMKRIDDYRLDPMARSCNAAILSVVS